MNKFIRSPPPPVAPSSWYEESPTLKNSYNNTVPLIPPIKTIDEFFDLATFAFIAALVLLSLLSAYFIFYLRLKSRIAPYLETFNSHNTIRFLLVSLISAWALLGLLRIPFFRETQFHSFLPFLSVTEQEYICEIHTILSLGLFEPLFLVTLLFLVRVSIKKKTPRNGWAILLIFGTCLPIFSLQVILLSSKVKVPLPDYLLRTSVKFKDDRGREMVLCTNPIGGTIIFGVFATAYGIWFLFTSWKVVVLVINKGLRERIYALVFTVLITLPLQILCLGFSALLQPDMVVHGGLNLIEFLSTMICASVGEGILVIKPILDALSLDGPCPLSLPPSCRKLEEGRTLLVDGNS